jgi:hypothetical protein
MKPAILRGHEHADLGAVATVAEGPCAIALSRGGARKTYPHLDPNEDATAFFSGDGGSFVAVADAHSGCEASEVAIARLVERHAPGWTKRAAGAAATDWTAAFVDAVIDANFAVVRGVGRDGTMASRTTLAFALARPADDLLVFASLGDSHVFRVTGDTAEDLVHAATASKTFLGEPGASPEDLREACRVGSCSLAGTRAVLLATDGISERGIGFADPARAVLQAAERAEHAPLALRALEAGRGLVEQALAVQRENRAGDNVGSAVIWLGR